MRVDAGATFGCATSAAFMPDSRPEPRTRRGRASRRWDRRLKSRWHASRRRIGLHGRRLIVSNALLAPVQTSSGVAGTSFALLVARHDWPIRRRTGLSDGLRSISGRRIFARRAPARSGRHECPFASLRRGPRPTIHRPAGPRETIAINHWVGTWWRSPWRCMRVGGGV